MRIFVTGTDTDVGKTYISCGLLDAFQQNGLSTIGIKPVASGCDQMEDGLRNQDALALQAHASLRLPYELINPIAFVPAIAPHIAAAQINYDLSIPNILAKCAAALDTAADIHLIEGAGGWLVPLNQDQTFADLAKALRAKIILVVGMRLGCINHTLLTAEAIKNRGCELLGWVANCIDPEMKHLDDNILTLREHIAAPLLSTVPYQGTLKLPPDLLAQLT